MNNTENDEIKKNKNYSMVDSNNRFFDEKLDILFNKKNNGFYIELGAYDGLEQSNTAYLNFTRNWTGILIEPSMKLYNKCILNRPNNIVLNYCCVSNDFTESTCKGDFNGSLMSSVNGNRLKSNDLVEVNTITLEKILDNYLDKDIIIDLLSLDTEGYEYYILQGLNLNKYRPRYLLIEIYNYDYEKIYNYLNLNHYLLLDNFSNYSKETNPNWDGTHNDYLFIDNKYN